MTQAYSHSDGQPPSARPAPASPTTGRPSLVLWLGDGQGAMLEGLDRAVVGTVAASLPQAARNTTALRTARRELGLGQMFDLECWRLQLELGHPARSEAWKTLGMDNGRVYRPDRHVVKGKVARDQAERAMNAQLPGADPNVDGPAVDPSIFTTPAHWLPGEQAGLGRHNDLARPGMPRCLTASSNVASLLANCVARAPRY